MTDPRHLKRKELIGLVNYYHRKLQQCQGALLAKIDGKDRRSFSRILACASADAWKDKHERLRDVAGEYIALLHGEVSALAPWLAVHGYECSAATLERANRLRAELAEAGLEVRLTIEDTL